MYFSETLKITDKNAVFPWTPSFQNRLLIAFVNCILKIQAHMVAHMSKILDISMKKTGYYRRYIFEVKRKQVSESSREQEYLICIQRLFQRPLLRITGYTSYSYLESNASVQNVI